MVPVVVQPPSQANLFSVIRTVCPSPLGPSPLNSYGACDAFTILNVCVQNQIALETSSAAVAAMNQQLAATLPEVRRPVTWTSDLQMDNSPCFPPLRSSSSPPSPWLAGFISDQK